MVQAATIKTIADDGRPERQTIAARPFVKWVGGKSSIITELSERLPEQYSGYQECFMGGAAFFFAIQPEQAFLSDVNLNLVLAYQSVRDHLEGVIAELEVHKKNHAKNHYLKVREEIAHEEDPVKVAGMFIYLNKTCYNGLYRVNKSGKFNVPMGGYVNPTILDESNLRNVALALQGVTIKHRPFTQVIPENDVFYYLDPPYHKTYSGYNPGGFSDEKHEQLAKKCRDIDAAGGYFMLSNSDTDFIRDLYKGYLIEDMKAGRSVSCKPSQRGKKSEFLIRNYE